MAFVKIDNGVELFVTDWGSGKPIVFIHGFPFSHRIFEYSMTALAKQGYRAVGIDLRGFGQSSKTWKGLNYDTWIQDIHHVMTSLDLENVTLVGFSMGGAIASHFVANQQDKRVDKLVLIGAAAPTAAPREEDKATIEGFIKAIHSNAPGFISVFIKHAFHQPLNDEQLQFLVNIGTQASIPALIGSQHELRDRNLAEELAKISIPTLICHGIHDRIVPLAVGKIQQQMIQGATLIEFLESGHGIFYEEKERLTQEVLNFVK